MKFILPLPPAINQTYKVGNGKFYKARHVKDWENEAMYELLRQRKPGTAMFINPVSVDIDFYFIHARDIDASIKVLLDVLEKAGIYANDGLIEKLCMRKHITDKTRVEVSINDHW